MPCLLIHATTRPQGVGVKRGSGVGAGGGTCVCGAAVRKGVTVRTGVAEFSGDVDGRMSDGWPGVICTCPVGASRV